MNKRMYIFLFIIIFSAFSVGTSYAGTDIINSMLLKAGNVIDKVSEKYEGISLKISELTNSKVFSDIENAADMVQKAKDMKNSISEKVDKIRNAQEFADFLTEDQRRVYDLLVSKLEAVDTDDRNVVKERGWTFGKSISKDVDSNQIDNDSYDEDEDDYDDYSEGGYSDSDKSAKENFADKDLSSDLIKDSSKASLSKEVSIDKNEDGDLRGVSAVSSPRKSFGTTEDASVNDAQKSVSPQASKNIITEKTQEITDKKANSVVEAFHQGNADNKTSELKENKVETAAAVKLDKTNVAVKSAELNDTKQKKEISLKEEAPSPNTASRRRAFTSEDNQSSKKVMETVNVEKK